MKKWNRLLAILLAIVILSTGGGVNLGSFADGEATVITNFLKPRSDTPKDVVVEKEGERVSLRVEGTNLADEKIDFDVKRDGVTDEEVLESKDLGIASGTRLFYTFDFPANTSAEAKVYEVIVWVKGDTVEHKVTVTVKANDNVVVDPEPNPAEQPVLSEVKFWSRNTEGKKEIVDFTLKGLRLENAELSKVKAYVSVGENRMPEIEKTLAVKLYNVGRAEISAKISIPLNYSNEDIIYFVNFNIDGSDDFDSSTRKTLTMKPEIGGNEQPPVFEEKILSAETGSILLDSKGGEASFDIFVKSGTSNEKIRVQVEKNGELTNIGSSSTVSGSGARRRVAFSVPENKSNQEVTYKARFNGVGDETNYQSAPIVTIKVAASEQTATKIDRLSIKKPNFDNKGGETSVSVIGENLESNLISLKVVKVDRDQETDQPEIYQDVKFMGVKTTQSAHIKFPASTGKTTYKVKVGLNGEFTHEAEVVVGTEVSGDTISLMPSVVYTNKENTIINMLFDESIAAVKDNEAVRKGILLDIDGDKNFEPLSEEAQVEIKENMIIIKLPAAVEQPKASSKIKMNERIIKTEQGKENQAYEFFVTKNGIVHEAKIVQGEILDFNGGEVKVELKGENFVQEQTKVLVTKLQEASAGVVVIDAEVDVKSQSEAEITFTAPKNTGSRTESYLIRVSLDGGKKYSAAVGHNIFDRTKRLVASVLPEGVPMDAQTLSFISIQSYGTIGGGSDTPNNTHAVVPIGQESKKTYVYIYGTNLKKTGTKIKIVDRNGIEWTPISDPTSDSVGQFIMVGFDGTGIDGNGNNQHAEIIGMNNLKDDQTFKYLFAVDSKNFDEEVFATITILDDKKPGKALMTEEQIKEISVTHYSEDGKEIAPASKARGYLWTKTISFGVAPIEVDGYEVIGYRSLKMVDGQEQLTDLTPVSVLNELMKNTDEIRFIYKNLNPSPNPEPTPQPNPSPSSTGGGSGGGQSSVRPDSSKATTIAEDKTPLSDAPTKTVYTIKAYSNEMQKNVNGEITKYQSDAASFIQEGRMMVPLRLVAEGLGYQVKWNAANKTVEVIYEDKTVTIQTATGKIMLQNQEIQVDNLFVLRNGRVFLSVSNLAKVLGLQSGTQILWNAETKSVEITR